MKLNNDLHLAYCTNIHRGESWQETFAALEEKTLAVKEQVCPEGPYAIGLRLSDQAARELSEPTTLNAFREWLADNNCYIFTINGFPFGQFHGDHVKEQAYIPDWTTQNRVDYTKRLFDLLAQLLPPDAEGSVSTVPCSYKPFIKNDDQVRAMRANLWDVVEHIAYLSDHSGQQLHLGLEPEPLCYLETSQETVDFIESMQQERPDDPRLKRHLGVNYDTCHLAVEYEQPHEAIERFKEAGILISKIHLSSAIKASPSKAVCEALRPFSQSSYLHQVIERQANRALKRFPDLQVALDQFTEKRDPKPEEWRIHFHVPLHSPVNSVFETTSDHILGVLDLLKKEPGLCSHIEMETYTWEVLPAELKSRNVVDQLVAEYQWTLARMRERDLAT